MNSQDLYFVLREKNIITRESGRYKNHNHICLFFCGNWKNFNLSDQIVAAENEMLTGGFPYSVHAEINMLKKIQTKPSLNRRKNYDIIVVRVSRTGVFGNSRPCFHCIANLIANNYIKIKYVYYSNGDGEIMKEKLSDMLVSDSTKLSSGHRSKKIIL